MAYTPDPTDVSQPIDSVFASTAAAEFRALKVYLATIVSGGGLGVATPGQIAAFAGNTPLPGWLELNGSLQLRATFPSLWTNAQALGNVITEAAWAAGAIGAFSSGDLSTTFRLPDLRGLFLRGWNNGKAGAKYNTGRAVGSFEQGSLVFNQGGAGASATVPVTTNSVYSEDETVAQNLSYTAGITGAPGTSNQNISSVRPSNLAVMYCVKT